MISIHSSWIIIPSPRQFIENKAVLSPCLFVLLCTLTIKTFSDLPYLIVCHEIPISKVLKKAGHIERLRHLSRQALVGSPLIHQACNQTMSNHISTCCACVCNEVSIKIQKDIIWIVQTADHMGVTGDHIPRKAMEVLYHFLLYLPDVVLHLYPL
jgi:hypothetical protein